ncbi:cellulose synthase operon protein YhjQ [Granulicella pectinivorans]|jgi:cellulose synthase operon protein YhjQ|uniref:Cellulose synthase operon protein YhjQ n=1 Tax=Granulicella pectinivorans TaxID=474950 RepID=A0A1I6MJL2_9BACT|nr:cellulose synthase operon protein YhjQ/BcsQ [Granulicella pectinivorans]SFS15821.1 cellulose synthase operon protein YhjQ [Granulicella pectinivorans]
MDSKTNERIDDQPISETPEDVAILYSWANLHGAKYRDFSASRREYRAQLRHRAAENARELELKAQAEAEAAASEAERVAREAEEAANKHFAEQDAMAREKALREAEEAARLAAAERVEAGRRAEAAQAAEAAARREEQEMAQANASARRQAQRYNESEIRRRELAGPQPSSVVPGQISDPYMPSDQQFNNPEPMRQRPSRERHDLSIIPETIAPLAEETRRRPQGFRPDESSGYRPSYRPAPVPAPEPASYRVPERDAHPEMQLEPRHESPRHYIPETRPEPRPDLRPDPVTEVRPAARLEYRAEQPRQDYVEQRQVPPPTARPYTDSPVGPAWLYAPQTPSTPSQPRPRATVSAPPADTLQHSRERVAARWFALKGVFDQPGSEQSELQAARQQKEARVPLVAIFSLAGGVGKTSLVATLGRTLSSLGERVVLTDTTSHGLLPFYFGASELRPGIVRTFSPPQGSMDAPISLVSYDVDLATPDQATQDRLVEEFVTNSRGSNRTVLDLSGSSGWVLRRLSRMSPTVIIPVAPDMNSVISLQSVEKFFAGILDADGRPVQPHYLLNQFDATLPLHLDVREVLRRQLGERLMPFVIRRSPAVSEALAEGMTVVDYAPDSPVAEDYLNVANWVRKVSAPASAGFRNVRWSER